jgi:hypothetical protein
MRHNCATHGVIEILEMGAGNVRASRRRGAAIAALQTLNSARALGGAGYGNDPALVPVVVRAVHVLVVRVVVIDLGVVQLVMRMRRIVPVLVRMSVIMVMRMAVGMLMHHVAMTVRMAVGVRMRVGVTMLMRMAVRFVVAMAMLVFAVRHFGPP